MSDVNIENTTLPETLEQEQSEPSSVQENQVQTEADPQENLSGEVHKKTGVQRRLERLQQKHEQELQALRAELNALKNPQKAPKSLEEADTIEEFVQAQIKQEQERFLQEQNQRSAMQKAITEFQARVAEASKRYPDWEDTLEEADGALVEPLVAEFIMESPVGPDIAYYLAKHPDEAQALESASEKRKLILLGKLEDKVSVKQAPKVTKAPAKVPEIKGAEAAVVLDRTKATTYAEWKAIRDAERKK